MDDLLAIALIGTAKQPASQPPPVHPADQLVHPIEGVPPERTLLLKAGARALYRRAGRKTVPAPAAPEPAPLDSRPLCSAKAAALLEEFFKREPVGLRLEAIRRLTQAQLRLPPELLPSVLGERHTAVREALAPLLGSLGQWLRRFNSEWQWLLEKPAAMLDANAETIWLEGSPEQRTAILANIRARQPELGRAWLEKAWPKEKAEVRVSLLESFLPGLSLADEAFLEACSADRSQRVRALAAQLLAQLPGTAFGVRMRERAANWLSYAPPESKIGIKKLVKGLVGGAGDLGTLTVDPPQAFDKAWEREGIVEKPPQGMGNRAFWLEQVMSLVPPTYWESHLGRTAGELVSLAAGSDYAEALLGGWTNAACSLACEGWIGPLWDYWLSRREAMPESVDRTKWVRRSAALLEKMTPASAEPRVLKLLADGDSDFMATYAAFTIAHQLTWSNGVGVAYLSATRQYAAIVEGKGNGQPTPWLDSLDVAATALPESCFDLALETWTVPEDADFYTGMWRRKTDNLVEVITVRREFCQQVPLTNSEEKPRGQK